MKPGKTRKQSNRPTRKALAVRELSDAEHAATAPAEVPPDYAHLGQERCPTPGSARKRPVVNDGLRPRKSGSMRGKIWIAEDFDAPDPEIEELFNGADDR
jgi:hypothetical protein